jgi:hypothetical protein
MTTKLIFTTGSKTIEYWTELPFIPRTHELFNVADILKEKDIENLKDTAVNWEGIHGTVHSVEYRFNDQKEFFMEIYVVCLN